ncbi:MAG: short-chain dehydrogenase, partial [Pseudomonadota bacterium]
GQALGIKLQKDNVHLSVVCPGFVKSEMTDANHFPMPFLMPTTKAVKIIAKGMAQRKPNISFPAALQVAILTLSMLPAPFLEAILRKFPEKKSLPNN